MPDALTPETLDAIEAALAQATPGPWKAGRADMISYDGATGEPFKNVYAVDPRGGIHKPTGEPLPYEVARGLGDECLENARLIALLVTHAAALVASARRGVEISNDQPEWLCDRCNVIHAPQPGKTVLQPCPDCGAANGGAGGTVMAR